MGTTRYQSSVSRSAGLIVRRIHVEPFGPDAATPPAPEPFDRYEDTTARTPMAWMSAGTLSQPSAPVKRMVL